MIEITNPGPKLSETDIERVEANLAVRFPDDYRAFLLRYNGGRPDREYMAFSLRRGGGSVMSTFYSIDAALKANDLEFNTLDAWNRDIEDYPTKRTLVEIGDDAFGDILCLGVAGEELNKVYFRDMDQLPEEPPTRPWAMMKGYYKVADSFTEFLSLLGPVDDV